MDTGEIQLFRFDPSEELSTKNRETMKIEIHTMKRTGRKFITRISNLQYHIDIHLKQVVKQCREKFVCGGTVKKELDKDTAEITEVIQLQGHHKNSVKTLLIENYNISVHDIVERGV